MEDKIRKINLIADQYIDASINMLSAQLKLKLIGATELDFMKALETNEERLKSHDNK